jgi:hypothetical protein
LPSDIGSHAQPAKPLSGKRQPCPQQLAYYGGIQLSIFVKTSKHLVKIINQLLHDRTIVALGALQIYCLFNLFSPSCHTASFAVMLPAAFSCQCHLPASLVHTAFCDIHWQLYHPASSRRLTAATVATRTAAVVVVVVAAAAAVVVVVVAAAAAVVVVVVVVAAAAAATAATVATVATVATAATTTSPVTESILLAA